MGSMLHGVIPSAMTREGGACVGPPTRGWWAFAAFGRGLQPTARGQEPDHRALQHARLMWWRIARPANGLNASPVGIVAALELGMHPL